MTTAENKREDLLWNASVASNKSWIEIMEEEERELDIANKVISPFRKELAGDKKKSKSIFSGEVNIKTEIKLEPEEEAQDTGLSSPSTTKLPVVDGLPNFGKVISSSCPPRTPVKEEPTQIVHEDISLTGHLDGFKLISPCKPKAEKSALLFKTPEKRVTRSASAQLNELSEDKQQQQGLCKRKLTGVKSEDAALMPSPSKISRLQKEVVSTPPQPTRKRIRDNLTPTPKKSPTKAKREPETDPEVIARRQKQIDYGKNTIGYERYRQLVPKESRKKMHPRTPPFKLKFSRRAWDGLVRVWRQRLHFWDPPSEGGGNPECLEVNSSEMSDCSSTDGSLPNTPVQEWKRQKSSSIGCSPCQQNSCETFKDSENMKSRKLIMLSNSSKADCGEILTTNPIQQESQEDFLSQGCTPLPE